MKGKHLILDVYDVVNYKRLNNIESIEPLMKQIIKLGNLNVIGEIKHQFEPMGVTFIYLLKESHLSIHTYPKNNYFAIDLYCCNPNIDFTPIIILIEDYFKAKINYKIIDRWKPIIN